MILKETDFKNPLYVAVLENGVMLCVYGDYAESSDGNVYRHIGDEVDGELVTVGWECVTDDN